MKIYTKWNSFETQVYDQSCENKQKQIAISIKMSAPDLSWTLKENH